MKNTSTSKLSTWVFWAPLKFALTTFIATSIISLLYSVIAGTIYTQTPAPYQPLLYLCITTFIVCTIKMFSKLPHIIPDRNSFIATHNLQTILTSGAFILTTFYIMQNANKILFHLATISNSSFVTFFIFTISSILILYLIGVLFSNFFLKFRRIHSFCIPTWKIICSIPFGFSALWAPGYILKTADKKTDQIEIKSNWYKRLTNTITLHQSTTIAIFTLITMLSGFIFGLNSVLLTFILTLIFGIWSLTTGAKKFINSMPNKYAIFAIIVNITTIIILTLGTHLYTNLNTTRINISENTETINL